MIYLKLTAQERDTRVQRWRQHKNTTKEKKKMAKFMKELEEKQNAAGRKSYSVQ